MAEQHEFNQAGELEPVPAAKALRWAIQNQLAGWIDFGIKSAVFIALGIWIYHGHFAPRIKAVDMDAFRATTEKDLVEGKITQEEAVMRIVKVKQLIEQQPDNWVILKAGAVVENVDVLEIGY